MDSGTYTFFYRFFKHLGCWVAVGKYTSSQKKVKGAADLIGSSSRGFGCLIWGRGFFDAFATKDAVGLKVYGGITAMSNVVVGMTGKIGSDVLTISGSGVGGALTIVSRLLQNQPIMNCFELIF